MITDELREFARRVLDGYEYLDLPEKIECIADNIDRDFAKALGETIAASYDVAKEEIEDGRWTALPVDADGRPVHMDDTVSYRGTLWHVVAISHKGKVSLRAPGKQNTWAPAEHTHWHPDDTWDAIERDMRSNLEAGDDAAEWVPDLFSRCRFLADCERPS